jgi:hypothetical protein
VLTIIRVQQPWNRGMRATCKSLPLNRQLIRTSLRGILVLQVSVCCETGAVSIGGRNGDPGPVRAGAVQALPMSEGSEMWAVMR